MEHRELQEPFRAATHKGVLRPKGGLLQHTLFDKNCHIYAPLMIFHQYNRGLNAHVLSFSRASTP